MFSYKVETSSPTAPISDNSLTPTSATTSSVVIYYVEGTSVSSVPVFGDSPEDWEDVDTTPPRSRRRRSRPTKLKVRESKMRFGFQQMARIPNYRGVRTR